MTRTLSEKYTYLEKKYLQMFRTTRESINELEKAIETKDA